MSARPGSDLEALLAHAGWVRALASSLVADPNAADDLVQETWVAALEHPPREGRPLKRWLAAVLRNFAREERRTHLHRMDRERRSAHPEATPSAHDAVASALLQQSLIEAVLALDEPYRDAIIWRYFETLPPREIARRQGVSVNTVKTRLVRGLEKLRTELDRRHRGDRNAWLPALIPLAGWPALTGPALGTLLVNTKLKIAIFASLVLGSLAGVWLLSRTSMSAGTTSPEVTKVELSAPPIAEKSSAAPRPSQRETARPLSTAVVGSHPSTPAKEASPVLMRGRVIDVDSRSVAGVAIVSGSKADREPIATSRADGSFEGPAASIRGSLRAQSAQYTTVLGVDAWANFPQSGLVVVVAPRILLGGSVVDESGKPVRGAAVQVRPDRAFLQNLGLITDQSFEVRFVTKTDEQGQFEFPDAPGMPNANLVVEAAGFDPSSQPAAVHSTHELRIVLSRNEHPVILGLVLDARNEPVPAAWVEAGGKTTRTDAQGHFVFEPGEDDLVENGVAAGVTLVVVKEGLLPARVRRPDEGWPRELTIRLDGSPLTIRGRVVDLDNHPVAGAEVWTVDEHRFARVPDGDSNVEIMKTLETMLRGTSKTTSGEDGSFGLGGLLPGSYRIACSHKSTLRCAATDPVQAGSDNVTIRIPTQNRCVRVAGRVLSRSRKPVVGVYVFPFRALGIVDHSQYPPPSAAGEGRITDEEGRFSFELLFPDEIYFQVSGQNLEILYKWVPPPGARLDDLEIVVSLRCHVQVDLGDHADLADGFQVLDEAGKVLDLVRWEGPPASIGETRNILAGRSDIVAVSEEARTLVLSKAGKEVQRLAVRLVPGEVTVVRP